MNHAIHTINDWSVGWSETMLAVVWQSTILVVLIAVICLALRRASPAVRCWIWRIVAIKLLVMPLWNVGVPLPDWFRLASDNTVPAAAAPSQPIMSTDVDAPMASLDQPPELVPQSAVETASLALTWQSWLVIIWASVLALQVARLMWQRSRLNRLLALADETPEAVRQLVATCADQLHLHGRPRVRVVAEDLSPFVCGLWSPTLVLPASLAKDGPPSRLRQIVLHELAHVHRHDLVWCWITQVMRMVYWFHPVVYWVAFRADLERELACDQLAMAHSGASAADYAQTLIDAASRAAQPAALRAATSAQLDGGRQGTYTGH